MLPTNFRYISPNGFRGEESKKSANQKQESPVVAMFANGSGWIEQSFLRTFYRCFLPRFRSFGQAVSEKIFRNWPIRNKNSLWRPYLLKDRNEMSTLYMLPTSFGSFSQAVSEEKNFFNQPIRNKNRLWPPCLLMDRVGMSNLYRGPSIDASCQVSVHLAKRLQKRRIF